MKKEGRLSESAKQKEETESGRQHKDCKNRRDKKRNKRGKEEEKGAWEIGSYRKRKDVRK